MKKGLIVFLTVILLIISSYAKSQDYSEQAKAYFGKYLDSKAFQDLCLKSLPTLDDCKLIFKGENAYTFFGYIEDMKQNFPTENKANFEKFEDVRVDSFTTSELDQGKGTGGMKGIKDKLQPKVTFYDITYLREKGDVAGVVFNYWVKIDNRWVFFPKPWRVF